MVDHMAALLARIRRPIPLRPTSSGLFATAPGTPPAPVRDASTVLLLRDAGAGRGLEVLLIQRSRALSFAGGLYAYPGGRVDDADGRAGLPWSGPTPDELAPALGGDPALARALVAAAVRETFEEVGVLLASPAEAQTVPAADLADPGWAADRAALERREHGLAELLRRRGLALRADLLAPWARWITPEVEPRRYDTRFFVAAMPPGQQPGTTSGEAERAIWISPAEALDRHADRSMRMLPPTAYMLADLAPFPDVAAVLAAARTRAITPVMPKLVRANGAAHFLLPHDPEYWDPAFGADEDSPPAGTAALVGVSVDAGVAESSPADTEAAEATADADPTTGGERG
ncbi:MAG: NUDIX domain-containing protein [Frankia sp.]|nr:NUDIX domain-containing protein [Frankia sp.]